MRREGRREGGRAGGQAGEVYIGIHGGVWVVAFLFFPSCSLLVPPSLPLFLPHLSKVLCELRRLPGSGLPPHHEHLEGGREGGRERGRGDDDVRFKEGHPRVAKKGGREGGRTWFWAMPSINCRLSMKTGRCSRCSLSEPFWMKP